MSDLVILYPDRFIMADFTATNELPGSDVGSVAFPRVDSGWIVDFSTADETIHIDMGENVTIDSIAIIGAVVTGTGITQENLYLEVLSGETYPPSNSWTGGSPIPYVIRSSGSPIPRLDMSQPNIGPTTSLASRIMSEGRLHSRVYRSSSVSHRYVDVVFSHDATPNVDQILFIPKIFGGYGWRPTFSFEQGACTRSSVLTGEDSYLRKWDMTLAHLQEDELYYRLIDYIESEGINNRAFVEIDSSRDNMFYHYSLMCEIEISGSTVDGSYSAGSYGQLNVNVPGYRSSIGIMFTERFNNEREK